MKGFMSVGIKTKRYIKAFLLSNYGPEVILSRETVIGSKLEDLLEHKLNKYRTRFSTRYNATITVYITMYAFNQRGCNLNETNVKNFNNFVEDLIKKRFYELMDDAVEVFPSFEANIDRVRMKLGIEEDDWSTDSMKKDYYRYRKASGKDLFYKKSFSAFVPSIPMAHFPFRFAE